MCASLVSWWIFFIFYIQELFCLHSVPGESEHSSLNIGAVKIGPKTQNSNFLGNKCNDDDYLSVFFLETISLK
jgi:hypothetical protein